ncbi:MAG: hypothetical protein R2848_04060 [Thermomicrobiales bacterium]
MARWQGIRPSVRAAVQLAIVDGSFSAFEHEIEGHTDLIATQRLSTIRHAATIIVLEAAEAEIG